MISADLYLPKTIDTTKRHAALIVGAPYGGVKEQGSGIYAQNMAARGYVALTFDPSYNGYSGGEPRHISSPDVFVEDFSAAVDYIGTRSFVDRNKIGIIGICGSGGFALSAAQVDRRIKAIATSAMYDIARVKREGFAGSLTEEARNKYLDEIGEQRWREYEGAPVKLTPRGAPLTVDAGTDSISHEFYEYYSQPRGWHPNSITQFTEVSEASFMNFSLLSYIGSISPRPILFITGTRAHSRYMSEDAYKLAGEPKELYVVQGARHIDLYNDVHMIPFDKLDSFFKQYLR